MSIEQAIEGSRKREAEATLALQDACDSRHGFKMSIPANPHKDSDLLIGAALADIPKLRDALEVAVRHLEAIGERLRNDPVSVSARLSLREIEKTLAGTETK